MTSDPNAPLHRAATADTDYDNRDYWQGLIAGTGDLANVGQPELGAYNRWAYPRRWVAMQRLLSEAGIDLAQTRVFEAAFGEGFYLHHWQQAGAKQVAGIDISPRAHEAAAARFPDFDLHCGDLTDEAIFASLGKHDLVTVIDVLYHIVDDEAWKKAVANTLSLVDDGGAFVFTDKFPRGEVYQRFEHVRRRPQAMWEEQLAAHGFRIERIVPAFVFMDDPIPPGHHPLLAKLAMLQWRLWTKPLRMLKTKPALQRGLAAVAACCQWPAEVLLVNTLKRVPNLEYVLCRRA